MSYIEKENSKEEKVELELKDFRAIGSLFDSHCSLITDHFFHFFPFLAAFINPANSGCGFIGRDKNSGWN